MLLPLCLDKNDGYNEIAMKSEMLTSETTCVQWWQNIVRATRELVTTAHRHPDSGAARTYRRKCSMWGNGPPEPSLTERKSTADS
ncbi:hypothetical protein EVAR_77612_1 [Eumeta japonica]|uniref:Uncharacterized protein n=1 Tax=Eumeta variegata TaxID=151549 RepID=A0A4C1T7P1_EUMVA|nr:hypothetical protein EVAR_77612_1 [Eumeta japonica]